MDPLSYVERLKTIMRTIPAIPHVFIRHYAIRRTLQHPYDGPFPVVKRTPKYYTINVNGHQQTVTIDRLKPAIIEEPNLDEPSLPSQSSPEPSATVATHRTTRSGQHVH